jgi:hypothetical protein
LLAQIIIALYNIYRGVKSKSSTSFPLISDFMVYKKVSEAYNHSLQQYIHASAVLWLLFLAKCIINYFAFLFFLCYSNVRHYVLFCYVLQCPLRFPHNKRCSVRLYLQLFVGGFVGQPKKERESTIAQRKRTKNDLQNTKLILGQFSLWV